ncbi:MAG: DNA-binding transcriptional LysR family regulator [Parasphingorhabdus sp.]|jgi:DNA-binding transcriptional LysR family regulator
MSNLAITLEALEVLDAIDRKGSFAAAANILYKVPSAITYTVQKLEQDLGVTLFVKSGRKSVLTPAGEILLEQGREILDAAERLTETTRVVDSGWESRLNIVLDTAFGTQHIYPLLTEFFAIKPDIEINLHQEALGGGWDALLEGRTDIALGLPARPSEISGFHCTPLTKTRWVFAVHEHHPLASLKRSLTREDIECHRAVVIRDSSQNHAKLTHRVFSKQPVLSVQTMQDKAAAQIAGLGVGFIPESVIQEELASGEMLRLEVQGVEVDTTVYLAWRRGQKGKALNWFISKLSNANALDS